MACDTLDTWLDAVAQVCDLRCLFFSNAIVRVYGHRDESYQCLKCTSTLLFLVQQQLFYLLEVVLDTLFSEMED